MTYYDDVYINNMLFAKSLIYKIQCSLHGHYNCALPCQNNAAAMALSKEKVLLGEGNNGCRVAAQQLAVSPHVERFRINLDDGRGVIPYHIFLGDGAAVFYRSCTFR